MSHSYSDVCVDAYSQWQSKYKIKAPQCGPWEAPAAPQRQKVVLITEKLANKYGRTLNFLIFFFVFSIQYVSQCAFAVPFGPNVILFPNIYCHIGPLVSPATIGKALYSLSLHKLTQAVDMNVISRVMPLLQQAGCLGDNRALYLSSVLYSSGFGIRPRPERVCISTHRADHI